MAGFYGTIFVLSHVSLILKSPLLNKKARLSGPTKLQNFVGDIADIKKRHKMCHQTQTYYTIK